MQREAGKGNRDIKRHRVSESFSLQRTEPLSVVLKHPLRVDTLKPITYLDVKLFTYLQAVDNIVQ